MFTEFYYSPHLRPSVMTPDFVILTVLVNFHLQTIVYLCKVLVDLAEFKKNKYSYKKAF